MRSRAENTRTVRRARKGTAANGMTSAEYERAAAERFKTIWPPPHYVVEHNTRMAGMKSGARRQIDVRISEAGARAPFLIAEVKMRGRTLDLPHAGIVIALVRDVGAPSAVAVSASKFSARGSRYLAAEGIECMVLSISEAAGLRWLPEIEKHFGLDREFREVSGSLFESLRNSDPAPFLDNDLPYEEWLAVFECGQRMFSQATRSVLVALARQHGDDGVRFNAIRLLDETGELTRDEVQEFLDCEPDPDVQDLLREVLEAKAT